MTDERPCPYCGFTDAFVKFLEPPFKILKCRRCSLVYLANPPDETSIYEQYYEPSIAHAEQYRANSDDPSLAELFAINTQRISYIKKFRSSGTLLDVGCGRGGFLKSALDHGFAVEGIDVSERAIEYAKQEFHLRASVGTLDHVLASGKRLDIVTLWHVLEHFADPFKSLEQVRLLLHDGGICALEVPNLHSLKFLTAKHKWEGGNHPRYHRTFFTETTLRRALLRAGFSRAARVRHSYHIPGRSRLYERIKGVLNAAALDAFLTFVAHK